MVFTRILAIFCLSLYVGPTWAQSYIDLTHDPFATPSAKYENDKEYNPSEINNQKRYSNDFPTKRKATGNRVFVFNPQIFQWAAYDESGNLVNSGRASGGKGYCSDIKRGCKSPIGTFNVKSKGRASCKSSIYPIGKGGAPMPYCMFFTEKYAIHGSDDVPDHNASHGCIRVTPEMAHWLSEHFIQVGTSVVVQPY